eukprot:8977677-Prorocentrum_lima.AAC.1
MAEAAEGQAPTEGGFAQVPQCKQGAFRGARTSGNPTGAALRSEAKLAPPRSHSPSRRSTAG